MARLGAPIDEPGRQEFTETLTAYSNRDRSDGFVDASILVTDDCTQVVVTTRFASREQYWALADTTDQDDWYQTTSAPMLTATRRGSTEHAATDLRAQDSFSVWQQ